jgi:hypothetical protein
MGVAYGSSATNDDATASGTGNDAIANKDDEYAVTPRCRYDDDGPGAGNEWRGAWRHTEPRERPIDEGDTAGDVVDGTGAYVFELSRSLITSSSDTDAQFDRGGTVDFGFAFWVSANRARGRRSRFFPLLLHSENFVRRDPVFPSDALQMIAPRPMPRLTNRPFANTRTRSHARTGSLRNERGRLDRWRALRHRLLEGLDLPPPRRRERRDLSGGRC